MFQFDRFYRLIETSDPESEINLDKKGGYPISLMIYKEVVV